MKNDSIKLWGKGLTFCLLCMIALSGCTNKAQTIPEDSGKDSVTFADTLLDDTAEYIGGGKSINDIRFANFKDSDWLDNEYIRCLRRYLDDYNSGKIQNESLDSYKEKVKGRFIVGWVSSCIVGGLSIQIVFIDYPEDVFAAWVYSSVDEEKEVVLDYEVRSVSYDEEKSRLTKLNIPQIIKENPDIKIW